MGLLKNLLTAALLVVVIWATLVLISIVFGHALT